ncbi:hypothetical protein, partial [Bartonella sp. CL25QHWL]|uniref:hypothetical protein n=1 Tax=Bartonella sp. CL25QHWL TaxID=3243518 RepID=UPI0035D00A29
NSCCTQSKTKKLSYAIAGKQSGKPEKLLKDPLELENQQCFGGIACISFPACCNCKTRFLRVVRIPERGWLDGQVLAILGPESNGTRFEFPIFHGCLHIRSGMLHM